MRSDRVLQTGVTMRRIRVAVDAAILLLLLAAVALPAAAQRHGYARWGGDLTRILLEPGVTEAPTTTISLDLVGQTSGLAAAPDGQLYLTNRAAGVESLVLVDPISGTSTTVGPLAVSVAGDLAVDEQGQLYMASDGELYRVDPDTAGVVAVGTDTTDLLALAHHGGQLYGIDLEGTLADPVYELVTIALPSGQSTVVSELQGFINEACFVTMPQTMDFDRHGVLWVVVLEWHGGGCITPFPATSYAYFEDLATGEMSGTQSRPGGLSYLPGLAIQHQLSVVEVPALSPVGLLVLTLILLGFGSRTLSRARPNRRCRTAGCEARDPQPRPTRQLRRVPL